MPQHFNRIVFGDDYTDVDDYYHFDDMLGAMVPKSEKLEFIPRRGHRNYSVRKNGVWADKSQITTVLGVSDRDVAIAAINAYIALKDGNPYNVWQHSTDYGYFQVEDVVMLPLTPLGAHAGYLLPSATIEMRCAWTLVSVDDPT